MARIIRKREVVAGGYTLTVEVENAYRNGKSRFDKVFVADAAVRGKTPTQVLQAVVDAMEDPLEGITGREATAPATSKDILEERMKERYETWLRWKTTRDEAVARNEPGIQNGLTNKMNQAWARYVEIIQLWRAAP